MNTNFGTKIKLLTGAAIFTFSLINTAQAATDYVDYCSPNAFLESNNLTYRNLFTEYGIATQSDVNTRVNAVYNQLVSGTGNITGKQLFHTVSGSNPTMMYVLNDGGAGTSDDDIRSEGMSYAMFAAMEMGDKATFDALWHFVLKYMLQKDSGGNPDHFAWQLNASSPYSPKDTGPAPDGEEYILLALNFANFHFGSDYSTPTGDLNYNYWSQQVGNMLTQHLYNKSNHMVLFSPNTSKKFTDPSYNLPAFYQLFARWGDEPADDTFFWTSAEEASRAFMPNAMKPIGLTSEYANFDGTPVSQSDSGTTNANASRFANDSWRVVQNIALDYYWCTRGTEQQNEVSTILTFFNNQGGTGARKYGQNYDKNGTVGSGQYDNYKAQGLIATNAVGALAVDQSLGKGFVQDLWNSSLSAGDYSYYDNMLTLLAYLHVSGKAQIYNWAYNDPAWARSASSLQMMALQTSNLSQPRIIINNTTANSISNFTAKYFVTADNGKTPAVDAYWTPSMSSISMQHIAGNQWAVVMNYAGKTLAAGASLPASGDGDNFGIHNTDWSNRVNTNDFSNPTSTVYTATSHIAVYDSSGKLIMGKEPPVLSSYPITVHARGTSGQEVINLTVGGTVVATWTLSTSFKDYTVNTTLGGGINVVFTNDAANRDVQLDYVSINGVINQAEAQTYNTAAWGSGGCGTGQFTEWMTCNGAIGFSAYR